MLAAKASGYLTSATFQPTLLYELIFDLALAAALVWLSRHRAVRPPGIFALYVADYSAFRIFEELLRVDPAHYILGERLNFWVASILTVTGLGWLAWAPASRRRPELPGIGWAVGVVGLPDISGRCDR